MRDSRRTSFLLAAAAALLLVHFFPRLAAPIAWLAGALAVLWVVFYGSRVISFYRDKRASAAQQAADDRQYSAYKSELDALNAQFDPNHAWNDSTDYPPAYRNALSTLHERYRAMLARRFGPS